MKTETEEAQELADLRRYSVAIVLEQKGVIYTGLTLELCIVEARSKEEAIGRAIALVAKTTPIQSPAIRLIQALEI